MNAAERERSGQHADVLPVELFLLLALDEHLGEAVRHVLASVHALLHSHHHRPVHLEEVVVKLCGASVGLAGKPLERFNKVHEVRERPYDRRQ